MGTLDKIKRRHYLIRKNYQVKFILKFCLVLLAGSIVSTLLLMLLSHDTLTSTFSNSRLVIQNTSQAILPAVLLTNLITLILITLAAIGVILILSHKIAGPVFVFGHITKEVGKGNLTRRFKLRRHDQFADLGDSLNKMITSLHTKTVLIKEAAEAARQTSQKDKSSPATIQAISKVVQTIDEQFDL